MSALSTADLQSAVFAELTADAPLMAKINAVWDEPDEGASFPYVTIGDGTTADWSTKSTLGSDHRLTIHAWSDAGGRMEVKEILDLVHDALHLKDLVVGSNTLVFLRFERGEDKREEDGIEQLYHGILTFRALVQGT